MAFLYDILSSAKVEQRTKSATGQGKIPFVRIKDGRKRCILSEVISAMKDENVGKMYF
jgi:hypothetical protein